MSRGPLKWIASRQDPLDFGTAAPSFPYSLYRRIAQQSDVLEALGPDCQIIEADLGTSVFGALVELIWQFNCSPLLFTSHTLAGVDQFKTMPEEFAWAAHRAFCQICILPRDQPTPDVETARNIVNGLHEVTFNYLRDRQLPPPKGTLIHLEPIRMKFWIEAHGSFCIGFGVQVTVDGYSGRIEQARVRCGRALSLFSAVLRAARI